MAYDFNALEMSAKALREAGRHADALKIYYYMAEGDSALDGGWYGAQMAACYEALGDLHAARYWHSRAVEENPEIWRSSAEALRRLADLSIDDYVIVKNTGLPPAYLRKR